MSNALRKEMKLAASPIAFFFIAFGLMFFLPGYPILCGPFFVSLGVLKSFEYSREAGDITFSMLLPLGKKDIVRSKIEFVCLIEVASLLVMAIAVACRMSIFVDSKVYLTNALMNANLFALGMACVIYGIFNLIFVAGYFRTAYKTGKPFICFIVACFITIVLAESLHFIPETMPLNAFGIEYFTIQLVSFIILMMISVVLTCIAYKLSVRRFEMIDL